MKTLLGRFYKEGLGDGCYGIPLNVDRCFDLIGVAAAENDPGALFLLSELYAQEEPIKALSDQTPQERQNQRYKYLGRALNFGSIEAPILLAGLLKTFYSSYSQMEKVRSQIDAFEDPFAVEGVEPTCFCTLQIEKIDKFLVFHQQIIKDLDLHDLTFQEINANNDTCDAFKKFYLDSKILRDATLHHATIETKKKEIYELVQTEDKKLDPQIIQDIKNLGDEQILHFAKSVGQIFGEDYLNSPTITKILQISVLNSEQEKIEYEELYLSANQVYLRNVDTETGVVRSTDTPKRSFSKELFLQQRNGIGSKNAPVETKAGVYISLKDQKTVVDDELMEAVNKGDAEAQLNLGFISYVAGDFKKAYQYFSLSAAQGNSDAQSNLGALYETGKGVSKDFKKAYEYYLLSAKQGNPNGHANIGALYLHGHGVPLDYHKSVQLLTIAINHPQHPNSDAQSNLGVMCEIGKGLPKDMQKAFHYYGLSEKQENPYGQYNLGAMYRDGKGVPQDQQKAFQYFLLSAEKNHPDAQYNLGVMYEEGKVVTKDITKAIEFYTLAANQSHGYALSDLGAMYFAGVDVPQDYEKAFYFLVRSAEIGNPHGQFNLGIMYSSGQGVPQDQKKATECFLLAANQGNPNAQLQLGIMYGGVHHDFKKAIYWFTLSARQGNADAQYWLGVIYESGNGILQDLPKAIDYFKQSANQSNPDAAWSLGLIYKNGKGVQKDIKEAIRYFTIAADGGNLSAQLELGLIYKNGHPEVPIDIDLAMKYLTMAAAQENPIAQTELGRINVL